VNYMLAENRARLDRISLALMSHLILTNDEYTPADRHAWMAEEAVKYALALMKAQDDYVVPTEPDASIVSQSPPHSHSVVLVSRDCGAAAATATDTSSGPVPGGRVVTA
jgi:hypothetical protein